MPIKKVYTSDKVVYRETIEVTGFPSARYFNETEQLRLYEEYISSITGLSAVRDPDNVTAIKIHLRCNRRIDPWPSWGTGVCQFDGVTGAFDGWVEGWGGAGGAGGGGIGGHITVSEIVTDAQGNIWGWDRNLIFKKLNPLTNIWEDTGKWYNFFGANIGSFRGSSSPYVIDLVADRYVTRLGADSANSLSICEYSTGDFLYRVYVCGRVDGLFAADNRRAYAVADDGVMTVFDYVTGQVLGAFDSGISDAGNEAWSWDPIYRRILHCPKVPDTLPDGHCNIRVYGYYPVPLAVGMTPPIPLKTPRKGVTVPVYCRVYGGAGEGIPGQEVSFSVTTSPDASVAPNRRSTAENGVVKTFLTGVLAGANGITAETEVPDA